MNYYLYHSRNGKVYVRGDRVIPGWDGEPWYFLRIQDNGVVPRQSIIDAHYPLDDHGRLRERGDS